MSNLKAYRTRIASVKSTRKITSAMKMVAASKLGKAQEAAESSKPYALTMEKIMRKVASGITFDESSPKLLIGTGSDKVHLLVVITANRGLCGGFNSLCQHIWLWSCPQQTGIAVAMVIAVIENQFVEFPCFKF